MIMAVQEAIESDKGEQDEPDEIWGGREWVDPRLVKEGRLDELRRLGHFDAYEVVDEHTKHVKTLLQWFECEDARGSPVQESKDARRPLENEMDADGVIIELDQEERAEYRKHVGLLQYVANDRFDLKYAVKEVRRDAARPAMVGKR